MKYCNRSCWNSENNVNVERQLWLYPSTKSVYPNRLRYLHTCYQSRCRNKQDRANKKIKAPITLFLESCWSYLGNLGRSHLVPNPCESCFLIPGPNAQLMGGREDRQPQQPLHLVGWCIMVSIMVCHPCRRHKCQQHYHWITAAYDQNRSHFKDHLISLHTIHWWNSRLYILIQIIFIIVAGEHHYHGYGDNPYHSHCHCNKPWQ